MKTYQQFNESLKDWYNKGRNVRIPNEDQASFKTLRQDDRAQQGKFIKQASKGKDPSKLTDDDFEGGALPRNMSQLKDFMQGKVVNLVIHQRYENWTNCFNQTDNRTSFKSYWKRCKKN